MLNQNPGHQHFATLEFWDAKEEPVENLLRRRRLGHQCAAAAFGRCERRRRCARWHTHTYRRNSRRRHRLRGSQNASANPRGFAAKGAARWARCHTRKPAKFSRFYYQPVSPAHETPASQRALSQAAGGSGPARLRGRAGGRWSRGGGAGAAAGQCLQSCSSCASCWDGRSDTRSRVEAWADRGNFVKIVFETRRTEKKNKEPGPRVRCICAANECTCSYSICS